MERTKPFLFHSSIREFSDLTNYRPNTTNPDAFKQALKSSFVDENNFEQKSVRSTSSRDHIKGITIYNKMNKTIDLKLNLTPDSVQNLNNNMKQQSDATTPRNVLSYSDQLYPAFTQSSSFKAKKSNETPYHRSLKVSTVGYPTDTPYSGQNAEKQNPPTGLTKRLKCDKSVDKQKLSFRDSLGSLSKQIKNTLKLPIKNSEVNNSPLATLEYNETENNTPNRAVRNVRSRAGSIQRQDQESYKRYEKASSFFVNAPANRLKRPKHLDLKSNNDLNVKKQKLQEIQKNVYIKAVQKTQKYPRKQLYTERSLLGRSTVTSTIFQNDNQLKYSSVVEPLTPQLRSSRKYDSYNYEKQKEQKPMPKFFESNSSIKPQVPQEKSVYSHKRDSSSVINMASTKSSFMANSSVVEGSKFSKDRDSLSSRERISFGKEIRLSDFNLGSLKGEGRFGKFYPAIHKKTGFLVGIKEIKKESLKHMLDQFIQQLKIQTYIDHPNIIKLYGYFCTKQNFYLILQYMQEGSLFSFIKKSKKLQEQQASTKLKQICSAVEYLHENEILHRDIKPENIVMTNDVCKLCDFGWAVYSNTRRKTYCGTLDYVCPQILQGDSYDACVDIWAIGVLAYEMIVGKAPFYNISRKETMKKIMECNFQVPKQLSRGVKDFILKALNKNPEYRQSLQLLCKHEFLN